MRPSEQARAVAAGHLARRDLTRSELRSRLDRAGVDANVADETLDDLERWGLLDEERFAEALAARLAERGYGDRAIEVRLEERGLAPDRRADALAALEPELARAERLAASVASRGPRRVGALLSRRGFGEDAIEDALARLDALERGEIR